MCDRGWASWMASLTQWMWVWADSGDSEGQGSLVCCSPQSHKESDKTKQLNNNKNEGWLPGASVMWSQGWNFQSNWRGERGWRLNSITNGQWFNQSCLCKEVSLITWRTGFWVGEHVEIWPEWHTQREHRSSGLFPYTSSSASLPPGYSSVTSFYSKPVITSK